ncbi:LacI family DNA-binding transcriptional regulator [Aerococcaceae bacterium zg-BR9]|uniref:LacI family DNA-binding transcriptional regulator n=1 Tax=Aerococcaceae bacterium zg-1292 TaxID=2774330 RepID=UPI0040632A14|nr:LacI family DNA-binding transcriptional regulator [Aerococcaceae bacterium zg-BR9]MBF6977579.1 LacI family DNA-binding transcriptional regulator [Aerococcaceae bacterium zg-BR22]
MTTIKEISQHSGFSQATISRLFNNDESLHITPETKKIIIHTALQLGYDRAKIKVPLETIAILQAFNEEQEINDQYFHSLRLALEKHAKINNMETIIINTEQNTLLLPDSISGFIGIGSFSSEEAQTLKNQSIPGVFLEISPLPDYFDLVKPDTSRMTRQAIDLFIEKGYFNIGFIGGNYFNPNTKSYQSDTREEAFRDYMQKVQHNYEKYIVAEGDFTVENGYSLAVKMINQIGINNLPQAILIASDTLAVGVLQAFNEYKVTVPEVLEIISINDNEIAQFLAPPLTTFKINSNEIAKTAIDLLVDSILYPRNINKTVYLGAELIVRKSFTPN